LDPCAPHGGRDARKIAIASVLSSIGFQNDLPPLSHTPFSCQIARALRCSLHYVPIHKPVLPAPVLRQAREESSGLPDLRAIVKSQFLQGVSNRSESDPEDAALARLSRASAREPPHYRPT
jgi:hypothetical protein